MTGDGEVGERLASARVRARLSQQAVADAIGEARGRQTVYEWEKGKAVPPIEALRRMCALYGVTADSILGLPESDAAYRLEVIGKIADGSLSNDALTRLAAWFDAGADALDALEDEDDANGEVAS